MLWKRRSLRIWFAGFWRRNCRQTRSRFHSWIDYLKSEPVCRFCNLQPVSNCIQMIGRVASRGTRGAAGTPPPPGPVEPGKSSLWIDLSSLDSVILIIVTCSWIVCHFHVRGRLFGGISRSWQVMTIAFRNLQILKIFWGRIPRHQTPDPPTSLMPSGLATMPLPHHPPPLPRYNKT